MTINAAYHCHMDDIVGSIEKKKCADLVVLDQDPMKIDPKEIINIKVTQTWFDGRLVYGELPNKMETNGEEKNIRD